MADLRARQPFPVPALCLWAKKDVLVPPEFGPLWSRDLGAEIHWIDDASHFIHVDQPKKVVEEIIAFDRSS
jgi:pimeloyl-ACP methyl ester carboxylesterase